MHQVNVCNQASGAEMDEYLFHAVLLVGQLITSCWNWRFPPCKRVLSWKSH